MNVVRTPFYSGGEWVQTFSVVLMMIIILIASILFVILYIIRLRTFAPPTHMKEHMLITIISALLIGGCMYLYTTQKYDAVEEDIIYQSEVVDINNEMIVLKGFEEDKPFTFISDNDIVRQAFNDDGITVGDVVTLKRHIIYSDVRNAGKEKIMHDDGRYIDISSIKKVVK